VPDACCPSPLRFWPVSLPHEDVIIGSQTAVLLRPLSLLLEAAYTTYPEDLNHRPASQTTTPQSLYARKPESPASGVNIRLSPRAHALAQALPRLMQRYTSVCILLVDDLTGPSPAHLDERGTPTAAAYTHTLAQFNPAATFPSLARTSASAPAAAAQAALTASAISVSGPAPRLPVARSLTRHPARATRMSHADLLVAPAVGRLRAMLQVSDAHAQTQTNTHMLPSLLHVFPALARITAAQSQLAMSPPAPGSTEQEDEAMEAGIDGDQDPASGGQLWLRRAAYLFSGAQGPAPSPAPPFHTHAAPASSASTKEECPCDCVCAGCCANFADHATRLAALAPVNPAIAAQAAARCPRASRHLLQLLGRGEQADGDAVGRALPWLSTRQIDEVCGVYVPENAHPRADLE
jgi:hypothetical protein